MSPQEPAQPETAHAVRRVVAIERRQGRPLQGRPPLTTLFAAAVAAAMAGRGAPAPARPPVEDVHAPVDDLVRALSVRLRPEGFDMGATVVVSGRMIEPRVWVRANGRTWTLTTVEAGVAAIRCRLEAPALIGARLAEALNQAVRLAEQKLERLHAASPTAEADA